jgi:hypothetical protein
MCNIKIGDIIPFGEYDWRVLDVQKGIAGQCPDKALIITENVVALRVYHLYHYESAKITWEKCDLREYLNEEFLDRFSNECKLLIVSDVFLLCTEEAEKYFKDDVDRMAKDNNGEESWWWLRESVANFTRCEVAFIEIDGKIDEGGYNAVSDDVGGVRPALWVKLGGNEHE